MAVGILFDTNLHFYTAHAPASTSAVFEYSGLYPVQASAYLTDAPLIGGVNRVSQTPSAVVSTGAAHFQHTYFNDYYLRIHLSPHDAAFGVMLVTTEKEITIFNSFLTTVNITNVALVDIDEQADGLASSGLDDLPVTLPSLTVTKLRITADIDVGSKRFEGIYRLTVDVLDKDGVTVVETLTVDIDTSGLRSSTFQFSPFKKISRSLEWKTRVSESWLYEQRASLLDAPYETITYSYRIPREAANSIMLASREASGLPVAVPIWTDAIRIGALPKETQEIELSFFGNSFAEGGDFLLWDSDVKTEVVRVDSLDYEAGLMTFETQTNIDYENAFMIPLRMGYANKGRKISNYADGLVKQEVNFSLVTLHPELINNDLLEYHRGRPLLVQKNFQKQSKESFGYEFERLDGAGFGKQFLTKSGTMYYKRNYIWQCNNRAEIDVMNYFLHYTKGRCRSFYVPSFRPDFVLDSDITTGDLHILCKNGRIPLVDSVMGKSIYILLNDGTYEAREVTGLANEELTKLVFTEGIPRDIAVTDVNMICLLDLMRISKDTVKITHKDIDDVSCSLSLVLTADDEV